jgi:Polyketide cyclase / dehydrase and lipid transport
MAGIRAGTVITGLDPERAAHLVYLAVTNARRRPGEPRALYHCPDRPGYPAHQKAGEAGGLWWRVVPFAAARRMPGDGPYASRMIRGGTAALAVGGLAGLGYYLVVTGKLTLDTGWGRRVRPLGPFGVEVAAPATTVFDVIAAPYLGRTPRAMSGKLQVLDRGTDMVLAEHYTPVHHGRLTAATLETVTFDRPHRIAFRLVRGPVPHITEEFTLTEHGSTTRLDYSGELGTDLAAAGQWWAGRVAAAWEAAVRSSFASIQAEAERRSRPGAANH